ncbi:hypothetical protein CDN99_24140 [Roseateles aquatilis]|uniref:DNA-binding response regulator n=1 Tax=Roseateles aquatilis TaxID=431061 RepID=A0A246IX56_9BURK|nr:response regulator transcription factor [Roseateles aquatilis]OWQ84389.1 hypothetical protein CDN99_24140 [Roseateles aquatilis]
MQVATFQESAPERRADASILPVMALSGRPGGARHGRQQQQDELAQLLAQALRQLDQVPQPCQDTRQSRLLIAQALAATRGPERPAAGPVIRVIVADDHVLVREGLVALLEREIDLEVVAQARDGLELFRLARDHQPDLLLIDMAMPVMNGLEALRRIRAEALPCKAICLAVEALPRQVVSALDAGAQGYVLKENSFDELVRGVRRVMQDQIFLSGELLQGTLAGMRQDPRELPLAQLTAREREMVQLFSEGYSAQQIADQLHVSAKTVATHREHVYAKLRIQSIAELTRFALREGLSTMDARPPR